MTDRLSIEDEMKSLVDDKPVSDGIKQHAPGRVARKRTSTAVEKKKVLPQMKARKSMTIKLRPEIASTLLKISTLSKLTDDYITMQQIAEEAIEQWVEDNADRFDFSDIL